jgi:hypothetical protein
MTDLKITNSKSGHFNKNVKILQKLENEMVELFLIDDETIIILPLEDVQKQKDKTYIPKSRKDFYNYMQETGTSRTDIKKTIEAMIAKKTLELKSMTENELLSIFDDIQKSRLELIEDFRTLRNERKFDFNLINRS